MRGSRAVSRVNSSESLALCPAPITAPPPAMEQIRQVADTQEPVISFYFTQQDKVRSTRRFVTTEKAPTRAFSWLKAFSSNNDRYPSPCAGGEDAGDIRRDGH